MSDLWSRRKAAVQAEALAEERAHLAAVQAAHEDALAEIPDEELLAEHGQPAPEELDSAEAVQEFLKSALPQRLKTRALRRLWRLNPTLANLDGLIDYGEDFTDAATVVENMQTIYQVGKGMFDKVEELAKEKAAKDEAAEQAHAEAIETLDTVPTQSETLDAPAVETTDENTEETLAHVARESSPATLQADKFEPAQTGPEPLVTASRRMRFQFET